MRLFVAVGLPEQAACELDNAVAPLRLAWPQLRWTGRDAWHLTLAFLGEVDEGVTGDLGVRLARAAARHARLTLSLGSAGAFPGASRARVLWTGIQGDRRGLAALAASVAAGARRAGAPPASQSRRYEPHLTLARCRAPADVRTLVAALGSFAGTPWTAGEIYLIRSRPQGQPRYETLGTWPLLASAGRIPPRGAARPRGGTTTMGPGEAGAGTGGRGTEPGH
jgi:2'-5' RNA ligase